MEKKRIWKIRITEEGEIGTDEGIKRGKIFLVS